MSSKSIAAIVPAAGLGTRMKSKKAKFLHELCGRSIISHIIYSLIDSCDEVVVVVGNCADEVKSEIENEFSSSESFSKIKFAHQDKMLGSGDAVRVGMEQVSDSIENVFVQLGDVPLMTSEIVRQIISKFENDKTKILLSSANLKKPCGYGRIIRNSLGQVEKIVEEKDCDENQKLIVESNMYPFVFEKSFLLTALPQLKPNNEQKELYLTDTVEIASKAGESISTFLFEDSTYAMGVNDRAQLAELEQIMRLRINEMHMRNGVTLVDPANTYIDCKVKIDSDVTITAGSVLKGETVIGNSCLIDNSTIVDSVLEENVSIGPRSYLRPGTLLHNDVHIGTSVEIKNSEIGEGTKIPHLSYIGDCTTGSNCNLGAGTTTANFDGKNKHRTNIGNDVKLGVNTIIVAPVNIGDNVYSAAGAVITKDIPKGALAKGVPAQIIENWTPPSDRA